MQDQVVFYGEVCAGIPVLLAFLAKLVTVLREDIVDVLLQPLVLVIFISYTSQVLKAKAVVMAVTEGSDFCCRRSSVSFSASISCGSGSEVGFLDSASGELLDVPLTHSAVNL